MRFVSVPLIILVHIVQTQAQVVSNTEYINYHGEPVNSAPTYGTSTIDGEYIYTVGHTKDTIHGTNISVSKHTLNGYPVWDKAFNGGDSTFDFGVDVVINNLHELFVLGAIESTTSEGYNYLLLKYDSSGSISWSVNIHSAGNNHDYPASLCLDDMNNVYITGKSQHSETTSDILTTKILSNGTLDWNRNYDYSGNNDGGFLTEFNSATNELNVLGLTQDSLNSGHELTKLSYSSTGTLINVYRTTIGHNCTIQDLKSLPGNQYVACGSIVDSNSSNIYIVKFNEFLDTLFTFEYDYQNDYDQANSVVLDDDFNIYTAGVVTDSNGFASNYTVKLDNSGALKWFAKLAGSPGSYSHSTHMDWDNNQIVTLGPIHYFNGNNDFLIWNLDTAGNSIYSLVVEPSDSFDIPISIKKIGSDSIMVQGSAPNRFNFNMAINLKHLDTGAVHDTLISGTDTTVFSYAPKQAIVAFKPHVMQGSYLNDTLKRFGALTNFLKPNYIDTLDSALSPLVSIDSLWLQKVYPNYTSNDSFNISVWGDTIAIPPLWATFTLHFNKANIEDSTIYFIDSLLIKHIRYVGYNSILAFTPDNYLPNDPNFTNNKQNALYDRNTSNLGINAAGAWYFEKGFSDIRVGLYGTGVDWRHEEFQLSGSNGSQNINDYKFFADYITGNESSPDVKINSEFDRLSTGHETVVAGIIGAISNNEKGIAGLAGGDWQNNNSGVKLYSYRITNGRFIIPTLTAHANLLEQGCVNDKIHVSNHSYNDSRDVYSTSILTHKYSNYKINHLENSYWRFSRYGCASIFSSGNYINNIANNFDSPSGRVFPSSFFDPGIIKVGLGIYDNLDENTLIRQEYSMYGHYLDLMAPGSTPDHAVVIPGNDYFYSSNANDLTYTGTSFAAPYVTGTAALMLSSWVRKSTHELALGSDKLYPEDIEWLLEQSADDMVYDIDNSDEEATTGYDEYTGWGYLNAQKALWMSQRTNFAIYHYEDEYEVDLQNPVATDVILTFTQNHGKLKQDKKYKVTVYEVVAEIDEPWPHDDLEIVTTSSSEIDVNENGYWPLHTRSDLWYYNGADEEFAPYVGLHFVTNPRKVNVAGNFRMKATVKGYVIKVHKARHSFLSIDEWFPFNPNDRDAKVAFSVYYSRGAGLSKTEAKSPIQLTLYPNPAHQTLIAHLNGSHKGATQVILLNAHGAIMEDATINKSQFSQKIRFDIEQLTPGLYYIRVKDKEQIITKKFIKQ